MFWFHSFIYFFAAPQIILQDLSSLTRDQTQDLAVKAPSPNHWTNQDIPSSFILLHVTVQSSQHHLLKMTVSSPLHILTSFVLDYLTVSVWVYFGAFYPIPCISMSVFVPVAYSFDYCSFVVQSEVRELVFSTPAVSQHCFGYWGVFMSPYRFF